MVSVELNWKSGVAFDAEINGHTVRMDLTEKSGGTNTGPTPKPLMLASLAGCTAVDVIELLHKMRVKFDDLKIHVEAKTSDEHPKIYTDVHLVYQVFGAEVNQASVEKAVKLSQEKYCGVSAMFRAFAKLTYEIKYLQID